METTVVATIHSALAAYEPGDLMALSDLHECLSRAVASDPDSPIALDLRGCIQTIEDQLSGGSYDLDDFFFENIRRILGRDPAAGLPGSEPPQPADGPLPETAPAPTFNPEYIQTFCLELGERLTQAQELILKLETRQSTIDNLNDLFRIFHTIKGEAGFLKLTTMADLFHGLESLLDGLRKDKLSVTPELIDTLFQGIDLAVKIREALNDGLFELSGFRAQILRVNDEIGGLLGGGPAVVRGPAAEAPVAEGPKAAEKTASPALRSEENLVKVSGTKLSYLVDMIGEMLILQNQMGDESKEAQMLRKVSREVRQAAMGLTTINLKGLFTKMKRAVRDVSRQLDKQVTVETLGENNEIDRSLVEAVEEPLIHLVRNCIGHGIEDAETRAQAGKPAEGRVRISAERRGNHVILGIEDDGKGLDTEAILRSALKNGSVDPAQAPTLTEGQVHQLIFLDGLSTAGQVNDISGRGVGMSIVKKTIERFRGSIHIKTQRGAFTRFDLVFPLSMAILDGMVIELSSERFILPVENVLEAVRIGEGMLVEVTGGNRVLRLRGEVVPVVDLAEYFYGTPVRVQAGQGVAVLVENNKHDRYAFLVEQVLEKREVVIKSLGHRFENLVGINAAAILRGGDIGYLVDIDSITDPKQQRFTTGGGS